MFPDWSSMAGRETDVVGSRPARVNCPPAAAGSALDVAAKLLAHEEDAGDPHIPLLLWWAVEAHALEDVEDTPEADSRRRRPGGRRMCRSAILPRLMRRLAAKKSPECDAACARLLASAPSSNLREPLLAALDEAMRGRNAATVAPELARLSSKAWPNVTRSEP